MINLSDYLPVLIFISIAFAFSFFLIFLSWLRSKKNPYKEKLISYECGFDTFDEPLENTRHRFSVQFYLVAILFILFDLEITLLFPWALVAKKVGAFGFCTVFIFLLTLSVGFIYEWRKGALDWE